MGEYCINWYHYQFMIPFLVLSKHGSCQFCDFSTTVFQFFIKKRESLVPTAFKLHIIMYHFWSFSSLVIMLLCSCRWIFLLIVTFVKCGTYLSPWGKISMCGPTTLLKNLKWASVKEKRHVRFYCYRTLCICIIIVS